MQLQLDRRVGDKDAGLAFALKLQTRNVATHAGLTDVRRSPEQREALQKVLIAAADQIQAILEKQA